MADYYREGTQPRGTHRFKEGDHVKIDWYGRILFGVVREVERWDSSYDNVFVYFEEKDRVMCCSEDMLEHITVLDRLANEA